MKAARTNFAVLGPEEWCCGFPLIVAGLRGEDEEVRRHNLEKLRRLEAKEVVFSCPSCYHTWAHYYRPEGVKLTHSTEFIDGLVRSGKIRLGSMEIRATYHDPCDLGRGMRVFGPPRRILKSIAGFDSVTAHDS